MESVRDKVREAYSGAATNPHGPHAFPVGLAFARSLGYPVDWLAGVPQPSSEAFAGVSNVAMFADIAPGARVLDLGCGAGLDSFIAARRAGPSGKVLGIDFSAAMLRRAQTALDQIAAGNVLFCQGDAERLPLADASVDVAMVNGIFNLNPDREAIFTELARVVRVGGAVNAAEIILRGRLPSEAKTGEANWFA